MIPVIVTPYSFRGSILRLRETAKRLKDLGYKCAILADITFHAHVSFHYTMEEFGILPVHALVMGKKILIAKNREGFNNLIKIYNGSSENFKNVIMKEFRGFRPVMYLNKIDRTGYEFMRKILSLQPKEGDFSLEKKEEDPCNIYDFEHYDLEENQTFPEVEEDFFKFGVDGIYKERLEREVSLIRKKGFESYFKAVKMIVDRAKKMGIRVGPGRGSAVGSLVAYLLGITEVDPIKYNLLFERFINEGRKELPDIDIDVEDVKRRDLIKSLSDDFKFVALVSTYSNLKEKMLKNISSRLGIKLTRLVRELLMNLPVRRSIHAAGVIVSASDMNLPYYIDDGIKVCEYDMDSLKKINVEKIDILGLKTLSFLSDLSKRTSVETNKIGEQKRVYNSISKGMTTGIFQLDSNEARRISRFVAPKSILDLSHVLALNRPGPLKTGLDYEFLRRRTERNWKAPEELADILKETHGLAIYQEQIMMMAVKLSGMSLSEADNLRKAVAKKDPVLMEKTLKLLENGMKKRGYKNDFIEKVTNFIKEFASYAFNKSHSVAYAHISYWLSFYKENFFPEFMLSFIENNPSDPRKIFLITQEAICREYKILLPSVNEPLGSVNRKIIRLPITVIKGIGKEYAKKLDENKPFRGVEDLSRRVGGGSTIETLIKAGAFEELYESRRQALRAYREGDVSEILAKLQTRFGKTERKIEPEGIVDKILLENETIGFPLTIAPYDSDMPGLCEVFSYGIYKAVKVLSLGNGILTDGKSTIVVKDKIPSGNFAVVISPDLKIIDFVKAESFKGIDYNCGKFEAVLKNAKMLSDCMPVIKR
ncbi:MAG: DNA polymerase III subunit alpha [Thermotogaceae bacterium]|nr:DNA polymerase III subunit alpha [Thermotogaceae bacterium]